jgi:hypothetical protein
MSDARTIPREQLTRLLASALGQEKSEEVISSAARAQGLSSLSFSPDEVREIFHLLAKAEGLVGVVARFALSRGDIEAVLAEAPISSRDAREARETTDAATVAHAETKATVGDILLLLAPALGTEKARDATAEAAARLGLDLTNLTRDEAILLLDDMANVEGIVGVVARFAKARFLLT